MRIFCTLCTLCTLCASLPHAYAYPEYPAFEQTQFAEDFGMFRWWESCWWRVFDPYVYVLCDPNGEVFLVYPDGSTLPASQEDLARLFSLDGRRGFGGIGGAGGVGGGGVGGLRGRSGANRLGLFRPPTQPRTTSRPTARRLSPAPGDGFRLSDVYGGKFTRFDGSGFPEFRVPSGTGIFSFDGSGNPLDIDFGSLNQGNRNTDSGNRGSGSSSSTGNGSRFRFGQGSSSSRGFSIGDRDAEGRSNIGLIEYLRQNGSGNAFADPNGGTRMHDIFYKPIIGRCRSIYDFIDGGMFGPIPCTSHPWGNHKSFAQ